MTDILLQTKLFIPQTRPYLVPRPRLHTQLDENINGRITLISAPAGYGKTTLITSWINQRKETTAWVSLDEYDNDPVRFLRYFIAAWQKIAPNIGHDAQTILQSETIGTTPQSPETIITTLINEIIALPDKTILVIDDLHLIEDKNLLQALDFWIEHVPPNVHTVLISRTNPPLALAKWGVRGLFTEINATHLQFSTAEAADFLRQVMHLDLTTKEIALLAQKTDGWIASLQLAALSLQGSANPEQIVAEFTGSDRQMMAYLLQEVWQKQPEHIQQFLLQTALFHRFNVPLANAVTEFNNSRQLIDQLDRQNIFLRALDSQQNWYCYHPIFADFLQKRQQDSNPEQFLKLHQDASDWFAQEGLTEEAIQHALAAKQYEKAAQTILQQAKINIWHQNHSQLIRHWTNELPEEVLFSHPELTTYAAWTYIMHGDFAELNAFINKAESFWTTHHTSIPANVLGEFNILRGEMALAYGRFQEAIEWFRRAEKQITPQNQRNYTALLQVQGFAYRLNGDIQDAKSKLEETRVLAQTNQEAVIHTFASYDYAKTLMIAGELSNAEQIVREIISAAPPDKRTSHSTLSLIYTTLGEILLNQNQLVSAREHIEKGIELALQTSSNNTSVHHAYLILATVKQAQGDWGASQEHLEQAMQIGQQAHNERIIAYTSATKALLHLLQNDVDPMREWLENRVALPRQSESMPRYQYHEEQLVLARFLMHASAHKAVDFLHNLRDTAVSHQWRHIQLQSNILLALLHQSQNDNDAALTALADALNLTTAERYIYPFVREGSAMGQLLRLALVRNIIPESIGQIQAAFMPTAVSAQPLIEPLTKRELEILNLMANGRTNPEIAKELFLATGTVAKYSNTIYAKLAVRNRTEATTRAKTLGLIE